MSTLAVAHEDNTANDPCRRAPLVIGLQTDVSVTESVCRVTEQPRTPRAWFVALIVSTALTAVFFATIAYLITQGIGVLGNNRPAMWAFPIVNFVFWIGIGHAGTLISAILFLFRQPWRTAINRSAEAMTIFAVTCALIFPGIHLGRIWLAYWMAPYPNQMALWPNFRSPLMWDVFAVNTYFLVSAMFWYLGMIPDLAALRDRAASRIRQFVYGMLALGWNGSARQWQVYERAYLLLAALATPLVVSVHSVVSTDFAVAQLPGWHTTIFPPYFVAGAIFSGFAMVITLMVPARAYFGLKHLVTLRHLDNVNKIMLATSCILAYSYAMELFIAWYSGNSHERFVHLNRAFGPYAWTYWLMVACNVLLPQLFWLKRCRTTPWIMFLIALAVNGGMWLERFVIIVVSLSRDFMPANWAMYYPTIVDVLLLLGSFGLFFTLFLLFCRYLPMVAIWEVKHMLPREEVPHGNS